jgi:hypothetical protein
MHSRRTRKALLAVIALAALTAGVLAPASGPAGATGSNTIATPDTGGSLAAALALDASGNPVVAYTSVPPGSGLVVLALRVLHCGNPACTSGNTVAAPDTGIGGDGASLALDTSGNPVISYMDGTTSNLKLLHCGNPDCTAGNSITSPDTGGDIVPYTSLALDASGNPVVSYTAGVDVLKLLHCNDPNCAGGDESITAPDAAARYASGPALALDASGNPVVSFTRYIYSTGASFLTVLHCNDPNCAGEDESVTAPDRGGGGTLALDASGNPVISYFDLSNVGLKVLHCGNPACTSGNTTVAPLVGGDVGLPEQLALDASGNPVISYAAGLHRDPRVLHCGSPTCASGNTVAAPDTTAVSNGNTDTSLALDARGNPVVSYVSSFGLQVLHCGDPTCFASKFPAPPFSQYSGDVDCSQAVTAIDALLVLQFSAGLVSSLPCDWLANVYVDNISYSPPYGLSLGTDSLDAAIILQYVAGLIPSLPVCAGICEG